MRILIQPSAQWMKFYLASLLIQFPKLIIWMPGEFVPVLEIDGVIDIVIEGSNDPSAEYLNQYKQMHKTRLVLITGEPYSIIHVAQLIIDCKKSLQSVYLPNYAMGFPERSHHPQNLLLPDGYDPRNLKKSKFCAYLYSNPIPFREAFYDALCQYKPVDALGACKTNKLRAETDRLHTNMMDLAVEKYKSYKFVIAIENTRLNGYITEKLMNPVLARCVPIYLGAPDIFDDGMFNRNAMIHVADFPSYEDCVKYIKIVDQNDDLFHQYLSEPIFTGNVLPNYFDNNYLLPELKKLFE